MIRPATEQDVPEILSIYAPYVENSTATFEYDVPCRRSFLQRFYDITAQFPWLVWEEEGRILGYAYASAPYSRAAFSWCAEPSIYLCPEAKGRGIGTKLYAVLENILLRQGYQVLYALITSENAESIAFHQKNGYKIQVDFPDCGFKFGRWLGLVWMEKRLKIVQTPSAFPTPSSAIVQDAETFSNILDSLSLS
ncbi:MAG: N-acetyltransferase family protein [Lachnospiraceae bacterium]|nr:N-acetyltransferase family protein [Lachnospiraceae bacterium]